MSLIFSPMAVEPGSRKTAGEMPCVLRYSASIAACVLFPLPSGPSRTMNRDFNFSAIDILYQSIAIKSAIARKQSGFSLSGAKMVFTIRIAIMIIIERLNKQH